MRGSGLMVFVRRSYSAPVGRGLTSTASSSSGPVGCALQYNVPLIVVLVTEPAVDPFCRCRLNTDSENGDEPRGGRPDSNTD